MDTSANQKFYQEASIKTAGQLRTIAQSPNIRDLSRLTLPEIESMVELIGRLVPAGNVPGVILSGLSRISDRRLPIKRSRREVNMLFQGVDQVLDKAVYWGFFGGPAAIIWGYQNILRLAGKDPDAAFPDGTWQFYVEYALREDTARHANETHGFDTTLKQHGIQLNPIDRVTAWTMAAIYTLHQYEQLLANEWRERVYTYLLRQATTNEPNASYYANLYREWEKQRPYVRGRDVTATDDYPSYRRIKFDRFIENAIRDLPEALYREWMALIDAAEIGRGELGHYIEQMSILAYLKPSAYGEERIPIGIEQSHVGIIHHGRYYLIPTSQPGTYQPAQVLDVRSQIATMFKGTSSLARPQLTTFASAHRSELSRITDPSFLQDIDALNTAPFLINTDQRRRSLPLAEIRQAERGVGNHPLTIFDTGETFVFDQSHIFFDGAWGAALAEIMTNEALSWAVYLQQLDAPRPGHVRPYSPAFQMNIKNLPSQIKPEVSAENDAINIQSVLALRRLFKVRSDLIQLTVNDLMVLFRAIHATTYEPNPSLIQSVQQLSDHRLQQMVMEELQRTENPAVLIPVDASQRSPRDRLYPMTFEVPLHELDLVSIHAKVIQALDAYETAQADRKELYQIFDNLQRQYLGILAGFGNLMSHAKSIAISGESASVGSIKLLAHMPTPLQRLLDKIPGQFELLNDIIKGREVFSNVGSVAPTSTLTRFITAKDDNEKKTLAWGAMTDAKGVMRLSLRDFRPHVAELIAIQQGNLAQHIAQNYLDAYALGLNLYVRDLRRITAASRETRLERPEE